MWKKTIISASLALTLAVPAMGATDLTALVAQLSPQLKTQVETMISLGIDTPMVVEMVQNIVQNRINTTIATQMLDTVIAAKRTNLPTNPIAAKADEGFAKMVSAKKIVMAMKQVKARYAYARSVTKAMNINNKVAKQVMANISHALAAGMPKTDINMVMKQLQAKTHTMNKNKASQLALATTKMVATFSMYGVTPEITAKTATKAINKNATPQQMQTMTLDMMSATTPTQANAIAQHINNKMESNSMNSPAINMPNSKSRSSSASSMGSGMAGSSGSAGSGASGGMAGSSGSAGSGK